MKLPKQIDKAWQGGCMLGSSYTIVEMDAGRRIPGPESTSVTCNSLKY